MGLKDDEVREFARMCRAVRGMRGVAMFVTDRSPEFILEVSDYVYVLDGGRVIARGDPDSMRGRKEVAAAFSRRSRTLGEPTLLPAERTERLAPVDPAPPAPTATSRAARLEAALAHFQFHRDRLRGQRNTQRSDE
jgi:ABC-type multidrug transport system ATPase subunit